MPLEQGREGAAVLVCHPLGPLGFREDPLEQEGVYVDECRLEQVQGEDRANSAKNGSPYGCSDAWQNSKRIPSSEGCEWSIRGLRPGSAQRSP